MPIDQQSIYRGHIIEVTLDTVDLPNGERAELEIVHHPGGAAVAALDEQQRVCLLRQYRYAAGGWIWELPAGKIDNREAPLHTAQRELAEEAGVGATEWRALGSMVSSPGVFTEIVHLYLARGLRHGAVNPEHHEVIEVHWKPLAEAVQWALDGTLTDAKSVIALLRARAMLNERV